MDNVAQTTRTRTPRQRQAALDKAISKAHEQARIGNLPTLLRQHDTDHDTRQVWSIGSRTVAGVVYTIDLIADAEGITTLCHDCEAAHAGRLCWHRASARLAALGELDYHDGRERKRAPQECRRCSHYSSTVLSGREGLCRWCEEGIALDDAAAFAAAV